MGFLKNRKNKENRGKKGNEENHIEHEKNGKVILSQRKSGKTMLELKDKIGGDITRLIINKKIDQYDNVEMFECFVSWYSDYDVCMIDDITGKLGESKNAGEYKKVTVGLDLDKLLNISKNYDEDYCYCVMDELLDKERIEKYLSGQKRNCGNYIGEGICNGKIGKHFKVAYGELMSRRMQHDKLLATYREIGNEFDSDEIGLESIDDYEY